MRAGLAALLLAVAAAAAEAPAHKSAPPIENTTLHYLGHAADHWIYFGKAKDGRRPYEQLDIAFEGRGGARSTETGVYTIAPNEDGGFTVSLAPRRGKALGRSTPRLSFAADTVRLAARATKRARRPSGFTAAGELYDDDGQLMWPDRQDFAFKQGKALGAP